MRTSAAPPCLPPEKLAPASAVVLAHALPHLRRVGIIRRQMHFGTIVYLVRLEPRDVLAVSGLWRPGLALVRDQEVDVREERLVRGQDVRLLRPVFRGRGPALR